LTSGATVIAVGVAAGLLLSAASTRLLNSLLYGVSAADLRTFAWVTMLLVSAALLATYLPARRATRISAAAALRTAD
jgi:putative ABC transport system permease protein